MDEYKESEMSKIVKQLMDEEGFEFGEAVKEAMKRTEKANGGIMRNFYAQGDEVEEFQEEDLDVIELMKDQGVPMGEQVRAQDTGIMQMADRDPMLEDEYNKYRFDMLEQGLEPMDFDSFRREAMSDQAAIDPKIRIEEVVMEFIRERGRKPNSCLLYTSPSPRD